MLWVCLLTGCVSATIGYFEVSPYAQVKSDKLDQPLLVKFSSRVPDGQQYKDVGFTLTVTDFHKSLLYAAQRAFGDLFSEVKKMESGDIGFILEIQQMEPTWEMHSVKQKVVNDSAEFNDTWCMMHYAASLYRNELLVSQAIGKVTIKQSELKTHRLEDLFKEAVKQSMAQMAQEHYNKR